VRPDVRADQRAQRPLVEQRVARAATAVAMPRSCDQRDGESTRRDSLSDHQSASRRARASEGSLARNAALSAPAEQPNSASGTSPASASASSPPTW
jgi:hypothetical protein